MGCLKKIIGLIIFIFAIIGFVSVGGMQFVMEKIDKFVNPTPEIVRLKSATVADFSKIPKGYELTKAYDVFGYKAVMAEKDGNDQKILVIDTQNKLKLTQKDFQTGDAALKVKKLLDNNLSPLDVENLDNVQKSSIRGFGRTIPYIKFDATVKGLPFKKVEAIAGVVDAKENPLLILSYAEQGKFDKNVTEVFLKNVRMK